MHDDRKRKKKKPPHSHGWHGNGQRKGNRKIKLDCSFGGLTCTYKKRNGQRKKEGNRKDGGLA